MLARKRTTLSGDLASNGRSSGELSGGSCQQSAGKGFARQISSLLGWGRKKGTRRRWPPFPSMLGVATRADRDAPGLLLRLGRFRQHDRQHAVLERGVGLVLLDLERQRNA